MKQYNSVEEIKQDYSKKFDSNFKPKFGAVIFGFMVSCYGIYGLGKGIRTGSVFSPPPNLPEVEVYYGLGNHESILNNFRMGLNAISNDTLLMDYYKKNEIIDSFELPYLEKRVNNSIKIINSHEHEIRQSKSFYNYDSTYNSQLELYHSEIKRSIKSDLKNGLISMGGLFMAFCSTVICALKSDKLCNQRNEEIKKLESRIQ